MERYTIAGLMAAKRLQSQSPYNELLLARLPLANRENETCEPASKRGSLRKALRSTERG
jgi:hypothetical protein